MASMASKKTSSQSSEQTGNTTALQNEKLQTKTFREERKEPKQREAEPGNMASQAASSTNDRIWALSMMESSTDLMPTGSSMMPKTQAPSHGAGQTRPVNSGKLFVFISRRNASSQFPLLIRIFLPVQALGDECGQSVAWVRWAWLQCFTPDTRARCNWSEDMTVEVRSGESFGSFW